MNEYKIFTRNWWIKGKNGERVPGPGRSHTLGYVNTEAEAREWCKEWNDSHEPGYLSRKAEYMKV